MISCDMLGRLLVSLIIFVYSLLIGNVLSERAQALVVKRGMEALKSMTQNAVYGMRKVSC
jgi:hypothetical protein